ncbi:MAG TPA: acyltransferase [Candidatus Baltobacteraceae bacterium]|nr:acyltransferase [Candidatus Baltobacteraceae bacterium]
MEAPTAREERTFYPYVEGLRGVAALYVVIFHVWQTAVQHAGTGTLTSWFRWTPFLQYGHFAVAVFIVISGYCLGLPVAQRFDARFDALRFFKRRARRLMPAYVSVVFLSIPFFCATTTLIGHHVNPLHVAIAAAMHVVLIHNLFYVTTEYLNGPLWSIGLECQIYVVFALLLVPLWKRFGLAAQLAAALAIGLAPHFVSHALGSKSTLDWTWPWLLGLFAMGVVAASFAARPPAVRLPWNALAVVVAVVALGMMVVDYDGTPDGMLWPADLCVGAAVATFFIAAARNPRILPARLLALAPVVFLGTFSYSLYLIHAPIVDLVGVLLHRAHASVALSAGVWAVLLAAIVALAYGFYRILERPFLSSTLRRVRDVETVAAVTEPTEELLPLHAT